MLTVWEPGINNFYTFKTMPTSTGWVVRLIVLWPAFSFFHDEEAKTYDEALTIKRWIAADMGKVRRRIDYSTAVTLANQIGRRYDSSSYYGRLNREILMSL